LPVGRGQKAPEIHRCGQGDRPKWRRRAFLWPELGAIEAFAAGASAKRLENDCRACSAGARQRAGYTDESSQSPLAALIWDRGLVHPVGCDGRTAVEARSARLPGRLFSSCRITISSGVARKTPSSPRGDVSFPPGCFCPRRLDRGIRLSRPGKLKRMTAAAVYRCVVGRSRRTAAPQKPGGQRWRLTRFRCGGSPTIDAFVRSIAASTADATLECARLGPAQSRGQCQDARRTG